MPSISVLISVYRSENAAHFDRAMRSIWSEQTRKPDQIVLVKDGVLTKELDDVVSQWKKTLGDRLTIVTNEKNLGLTRSLNKGMKYVTEDYVARMDSDDVSYPDRFEKQANFLDSNPDISVVGGFIQEFNDEEGDLCVRKYPISDDVIRIYICKASPVAHPTVMMRRAMFDKGISYDERYVTSQDIALWFDVLESNYKIANIPDILLRFRRDDSSLGRRGRKKCVDEFKIYMKGIRKLHGLRTWRYVFPIARVFFRLMPKSLISSIYSGSIRKMLLQKNS